MRYQWTPGYNALWNVHISKLPLISQAHIDEIENRLMTAGLMPPPKPEFVAGPEDPEHFKLFPERYQKFALSKLEWQTSRLSNLSDGRQQTANDVALTLGPYVAKGAISHEKVWAAVEWASQQNGKYDKPGGRHAVRLAFAKGMSDGMKNPMPRLRDQPPKPVKKLKAPQGQLQAPLPRCLPTPCRPLLCPTARPGLARRRCGAVPQLQRRRRPSRVPRGRRSSTRA